MSDDEDYSKAADEDVGLPKGTNPLTLSADLSIIDS
jgi:hypothetical protein